MTTRPASRIGRKPFKEAIMLRIAVVEFAVVFAATVSGAAWATPVTLTCSQSDSGYAVSVVFDEQEKSLLVSGNAYRVTRMDKLKIEGDQTTTQLLKGDPISSTSWVKIDRITGIYAGGFRIAHADGRPLELAAGAPPTSGLMGGQCSVAKQKF